jgi:hypothetical protein
VLFFLKKGAGWSKWTLRNSPSSSLSTSEARQSLDRVLVNAIILSFCGGSHRFNEQHPLCDGTLWRQFGALARCSKSAPMARVGRTCIVSVTATEPFHLADCF